MTGLVHVNSVHILPSEQYFQTVESLPLLMETRLFHLEEGGWIFSKTYIVKK
jgi:hypothetical protein